QANSPRSTGINSCPQAVDCVRYFTEGAGGGQTRTTGAPTTHMRSRTALSGIAHILGIEQIDRDIYRGPVVASELPRTFGGQVAAQTLVAATRTVPEGYDVHSLHGYFLAGGDAAAPTIFLVDRMRDGRSFQVRQVKAVQDGQTIFSMQAS